MRYLLDEHLSPKVADGLRRRKVDAAAVTEPSHAHLCGAPDELVLRAAADEDRAVVTYDLTDFTDLHRRWVLTRRRHCGIVLVSGHPTTRPANVGEMVKALEKLAQSGRAIDEQLVWLEPPS